MMTFVSGATAADPKADAAALAALHDADEYWAKAYNAADLESLMGFYDPQAIIYPPGAPPTRGRAAIRAYFAKDIPESKKKGYAFSINPGVAGGVSGPMGWASGTYTVRDGAGRMVDRGWFFSVSRYVNGRWLYVRDAWNSDGSVAAPK
jgi:ketosteroid isomerase-like protein